MPIEQGDLKFLLTGGANNTNPFQSLGGRVSVTEIANDSFDNLFDDVSPAEADQGDIAYRAFAIKNDSPNLAYGSATIWIENDILHLYHLGYDNPLRPNTTDLTLQSIQHDHAEPIGVVFSAGGDHDIRFVCVANCQQDPPLQDPDAICGGTGNCADIPAGAYNYFWIARMIPAGTQSTDRYRITIRIAGLGGS